MGESPGDEKSLDAAGPNPFVESEEEDDDTAVCSVVEKSKVAWKNSMLGSPRKKPRNCGSADGCSLLSGGSSKSSNMSNSSLNEVTRCVTSKGGSESKLIGKGSPNHKKCEVSPKPGSSSPRPDTGPGSPSRRDLLSLPLRRPTGGCSVLCTKSEEAEEKGGALGALTLSCPMCKYTDADSERLQEHVNR